METESQVEAPHPASQPLRYGGVVDSLGWPALTPDSLGAPQSKQFPRACAQPGAAGEADSSSGSRRSGLAPGWLPANLFLP